MSFAILLSSLIIYMTPVKSKSANNLYKVKQPCTGNENRKPKLHVSAFVYKSLCHIKC